MFWEYEVNDRSKKTERNMIVRILWQSKEYQGIWIMSRNVRNIKEYEQYQGIWGMLGMRGFSCIVMKLQWVYQIFKLCKLHPRIIEI